MERGTVERIRRDARFDKDWTKGSILGNLWSLSWPTMITQAITTLGPTIDMIWVGKLGTAAIAGVGVSGMIVQLVGAIRTGLQTGTRAMVSRSIGAGNEGEANNVAQQSLTISILFAIIMAIIGFLWSRQMLLLFGLKADVVYQGTAYLRIMLVGMVTTSFMMLSQSLMQASGDARTPMWISIGARIFHIGLSPFLIFGLGPFPRMGVSGAALTDVIAQGVGGGVGMWVLYTGQTRLKLTMKHFSLDWNIIWRVTKIGIPVAINWTERTSANLLVTWFVVPFGSMAVAAHSLMDRVDTIVRMPAMGLGQAAGVLAGQNLGARQPERAEKTGWLSVGLFSAVMFGVSAPMWFFPQYVIRIFNPDPVLVEIGVNFLRIQIIYWLTLGFIIVLMNCLNGVGDTWVPTINTLTTMWLVQMPLAFWLPKNTSLGVYGVRWAMVVAAAIRASVFGIYFKMGRWKTKEI